MMVSLKRIDQYLNEEEELEENTQALYADHRIGSDDDPPSFSNASFSWAKLDTEDTPIELQDLDVTFSKGRLNLILGATGSGKSSLLLALLGEMRLVKGGFYLSRREGVAYVSQSAWLQNATIRDNILFGSDFDEERYWKVLEACALNADLEILEAGDQTEVGEKGILMFVVSNSRSHVEWGTKTTACACSCSIFLCRNSITGRCVFGLGCSRRQIYF